MRSRCRLRLTLTLAPLLAVALGLAGCLPPPPPPPPPSNAVMGQSRLTADQLVRYFEKNHPATLPYRATGATLQQLATMFVSEGNRYNVRGDIAFAQSILETGWFYYPDRGLVRPSDNNFAGIGACSSCGTGFGFRSARNGVRAQLQLLRNYADVNSRVTNIPDAPVAELWGLDPATANTNFDHYFHKGRAPSWDDMGKGNWAASPDYSVVVLKIYRQMLAFHGLSG